MSEKLSTNFDNNGNDQSMVGEVLSTERAARLGHEALVSTQEARFRELLKSKKRPDEQYLEMHPGASQDEAVKNTTMKAFDDSWAWMLASISDGKLADAEDPRSRILSNFTIDEIVSEEVCPTVFDFQKRSEQLKLEELFGENGKELVEYAERAIYGEEQFKSLQAFNKVREGEKLFGSCAARMLSKHQLVNGGNYNALVEIGAEDGTSEDAAYIDEKEAVFAVFDGVGGSENGRGASQKCADGLGAAMKEYDFRSDEGKWAITKALNRSVAGLKGSTTATIVKIVQEKDGGKSLHYVSVGDSRLYVVHKNGQAEQISHDDKMTDEQIDIMAMHAIGNRRLVDAAKRYAAGEAMDSVLAGTPMRGDIVAQAADYIKRLQEHGIGKSLNGDKAGFSINKENMGSIRLSAGDQIVLCSDGITGDTGSDIRSESEIAAAVHGKSSGEATSNLLKIATKYDDRTAIVVNV